MSAVVWIVTGLLAAVFLFAGGFLLLVATLAALVPAWRAVRVDPRESLAAE